MQKIIFMSIAIVFCLISTSVASELNPIKLPVPDLKGGKSLMQSLSERKTTRTFSTKKIPTDVLSNLLWAAFGINRPESGRRTAPSVQNWQQTDVYVATEEGLYLYNAKAHVLEPVLKGDLRRSTTTALQPTRDSVAGAPVQLIYVADYEQMSFSMKDKDKMAHAFSDAAFISQNVYLYCASAGLATGVRSTVDRDTLAKKMKLRKMQRITLVQAVGYPPDK